MQRGITRSRAISFNFDPQRIDVEIRDLLVDLNSLGYLETLYSCAGYGAKSNGKPHEPDELEKAYVYIRYTEGSKDADELHNALAVFCWTEKHGIHGNSCYVYRMLNPVERKMMLHPMHREWIAFRIMARWKLFRQTVERAKELAALPRNA